MRLDQYLVNSQLVNSRNQAQVLIDAGKVLVDGKICQKRSFKVKTENKIELAESAWVSRGAYKLLGALVDSKTLVPEVVMDAGASTGGFTQVLLSMGAKKVYAVDVGHNQLAYKLRNDPRVQVREGLNLKQLCREDLNGELVDLVVGDVSFISLRQLLAPIFRVLSDNGVALLLVKPQFEVGRELIGTGIVTDAKLRENAVQQVINDAESLGWICDWQAPSQLMGSAGNVEYFIRLKKRKI